MDIMETMNITTIMKSFCRTAAVACMCMLSINLFAQRSVTISTIVGTVKVQKSNDPKWMKAFVNMKLFQSDKIRTELGSSARIELADGTFVKLEENTFMSMQTLVGGSAGQKTDVKIWSGNVFAKVNKLKSQNDAFNLTTPTIVAGIRGTEVSCDVRDGVGKVSSAAGNKPGSIIVYVPGNRSAAKELTPGKAIVGQPDGSLSKEIPLAREDKASMNANQEEAEAILSGKPPVLEVKNINDNRVYDGDLKIEGKSDEEIEIRVLIDGQEVQAPVILEKKTFNFKIDIKDKIGNNVKLDVIAVDRYGQQTVYTATLEVRLKPMELAITSPQGESIELLENSLTVEGKTSPNAMVKIVLGDKDLEEKAADGEGKFSFQLNLAEIKKQAIADKKPVTQLTIIAKAGKDEMKMVRQLRFVVPEIKVAVSSPAGDGTIQKNILPVAGTALPEAKVVISLDGTQVKELVCDGDGGFSTEIDFTEYLNTKPVKMEIAVTSADGGQKAVVVRTIEYKLEIELEFAVENLNPETGFLKGGEAIVKGKARPAKLGVLEINGAQVDTDDAGNFQTTLALEDGDRDINAVYKLSGREVKRSVKVKVFNKMPDEPVITVIDDEAKKYGAAANEILRPIFFIVQIKSSPDAVKCFVRGEEAFMVGKGQFEKAMSVLRGGTFNFPVKIVNVAGNEVTKASPDFIAIPPPELEIKEVENGRVLMQITPGSLLTIAIDGNTFLDKDEALTMFKQIDIRQFGDGLFHEAVAYCVDKFGRRSRDLTRRFIYDNIPPELESESFNDFGKYYTLTLKWSEPCMVYYYPNGHGTLPERSATTDTMGNVTFKVFYSEHPAVTTRTEEKVFVIKKIRDAVLDSKRVFAVDRAGNKSLWHGGGQTAILKSAGTTVPRPPTRGSTSY